MVRKNIILAVGILFGVFGYAQNTVTGTVTDNNQSPLPGVTVIVVGTTVGVQTDFDGKYSIGVAQGAQLEFSYLGMSTQTVEVTSQVIDIVLIEDTSELDEVVVLGYTTRGKNELTGSSKKVGGDDISRMQTVNIGQALQGRIAGVAISGSSGTPGSFQNVRIRGVSSLTGNNEPLYVLDGVPMNNFNVSDVGAAASNSSSLGILSGLDSSDIESITVLKDASATSAYGARGSNGVIVITTKKAKSGEVTVTAKASVGTQDFAVQGPSLLTGAQREELYYDAMFNSYGERFGFDRAGAKAFYEQNADTFGDQYVKWNASGRHEQDWSRAVTNQNRLVQTYNVRAQGGLEKSSFAASIGYNRTPSMVIGSGFQRVSGRLNLKRQIKKNVKLSLNLSTSAIDQKGILEQGAFFANPLLAKYFGRPTTRLINEDGTYNLDTGSIYNPYYIAQNNVRRTTVQNSVLDATLEWKIIDGLTYKHKTAINNARINARTYQNRIHGGGQSVDGAASALSGNNNNMVIQNSFNYIKSIEKHNFNATLLNEYQENKFRRLNASANNFPADGLQNLDNASAQKLVGGAYSDWYNLSYLMLLNYNYDKRYVLDLTYRYEGSSRFAADERFGNFYAIGAAWNVIQEEFMTPYDFISDLRVKASYGVSGNQGTRINEYQSLLNYSANYGGNGASFPSGLGNPNLTWEKNANTNAGIEFGLFKNRLKGSVTYFQKNTFDLLQNLPLSRTTGFTSVKSNVGAMYNKGWEYEISGDVIKTKDLVWNLSFQASTLENKVTQIGTDTSGNSIPISVGSLGRIDVGHKANEWYMRKWAGVNPDTGDPLWYKNGKDGETTSDYNEAKVDFQGSSPLPTINAGLSTSVDYKGVFLNATVSYTGGHQVYENWSSYTKSSGSRAIYSFNGTTELLNSWKKPGDITDYPKLEASSATGSRAASPSTRFLYDGDFARLKNITLGYKLPKKWVTPLRLSSLSVSISANNALTWVKDSRLKYDPEVRFNGITNLTSPPLRSYVLTLNLKF